MLILRRLKRAAILLIWRLKKNWSGFTPNPFSRIPAHHPMLNQWDGFLLFRHVNFRLWVNHSILQLGSTHEIWLAYYYSAQSEKLFILVYHSVATTDIKASALIERIAIEILVVSRTPKLKPIILHPKEHKGYWNHLIARLVREFLRGNRD